MSSISNHPLVNRYNRDSYVDENAYKKLINAKVYLMTTLPFWGVIACDLVLVEDNGIDTPMGNIQLIHTLATDGYHIMYNATFVNSLRVGEVIFAVAHEIDHCLLSHVGNHNRLGWRDAKIFNKAADYCINQELKDMDIGEFITTIKILYDTRFAKMYTEQVYDILISEPKDATTPLDQHITFVTPDDEQPNGEVIFKNNDVTITRGEGGEIIVTKDEDILDEDRAEMGDLITRAVEAQYEAEKNGYLHKNKGAGSIPGSVLRYFEKLSKPKVNWKAVLRKYVFHVNMAAYSFSKPNKAFFNAGFTLPGFRRRENCLELCIAFDTSGSVPRIGIELFLSELVGILKSVSTFKIHVWCFDGAVHEKSYHILTKNNNSNTVSIVKPFLKNVFGGGGTTFTSNWDFMKTKNLHPRALLLFSDGYPNGKYGYPDYCPTLFLFAVDEDAEIETYPKPANFGKTVYITIPVVA